MTFLIKDEQGKIYNEVKIPGAVVDCELNVLLKIGEFADMEKHYNYMRNKYIEAGFVNEANSLGLLHLPKNQVEIDKVFQNTGYIEKYIKYSI